MFLKARDSFPLELDDGLEGLHFDFLLLPVELHFLLEHFFLDPTLHTTHAGVADLVTGTVLIPELIRLLVTGIRIEGPSEGELELDGFLIGAVLSDHLCLDQIVKLLEETQIGCLVVVKIEPQIGPDLSEALLSSQDCLVPQQIFPLLLLDLLIRLLVFFWGSWVWKGRCQLLFIIDRFWDGDRGVHICRDVRRKLLPSLHLQLHLLELLVLIVVHHSGARGHTIRQSHVTVVIGEVAAHHATSSCVLSVLVIGGRWGLCGGRHLRSLHWILSLGCDRVGTFGGGSTSLAGEWHACSWLHNIK